MVQAVKYYLLTLILFLSFDFFWLAFLAKDFYRNQIGYLMRSNVNWVSVAFFYIIFVAGLLFLVILPAVNNNRWIHALFYGALFGLATYATYDLTNLATLKDWPILVTIVDLAWGMTVSSLVSVISYLLISKFWG